MKWKLAFLILLLFLAGCATFQEVGSRYWHENRLKEIEISYQDKKVTEAEYLSLKNEADTIREEKLRENYNSYDYYPSYYFGYHHGYHYRHHHGYHYRHGYHH